MKLIQSAQDLAINGAPPVFDQPIHVGRPNIGNKEEFLRYASDILDRHWLTNDGPLVQELEKRIADHHEVKHCIAMSSGTVALEIAIRALKLEGEVIIPSFTFVATAHALYWQGITPIFADIDPATHNLDPAAVRQMITPRTTGIIGVHLWGRAAPVDELQQIAEEHNLRLMFDAAHAFGCSYKGTKIGNFGACEALSFHATKFFNTFEGGAVLTNDDDLAAAMRLMRNFGFEGQDSVIHPGTNGKMVEISAAMGMVNLEDVAFLIETNHQNFRHYQRELKHIPGIKLLDYDEQENNNYQYIVIEVNDESPITRDRLLEALRAENILARRYFWPGCHAMKLFKGQYPHAGLLLPHTEELAKRVIVLPTGSTIDSAHIDAILAVIKTMMSSAA